MIYQRATTGTRQQGGHDLFNTRRHHGGPGKNAEPELESLAGKGPGAGDAGQAGHGHGQGQLEGDPENRDQDQDKVDVAAGQWQVLDLARPKSDEEPQGNGMAKKAKPIPMANRSTADVTNPRAK